MFTYILISYTIIIVVLLYLYSWCDLNHCACLVVHLQYHSFDEVISILQQVSLTVAIGEAVSFWYKVNVANEQMIETPLGYHNVSHHWALVCVSINFMLFGIKFYWAVEELYFKFGLVEN